MRFAKYVALAGLMIASTAGATEASTITVEYYTTGVFYLANPLTGTSSIVNASGGVTIAFAGVGTAGSPVSVSSPDSPLLQNLGTFTVTRGNNSSEFDFSAYSFQLAIFQSLPTVGDDTLIGLLDGTIKQNGEIDFSGDLSSNIGVVTYTLTNLDAGNVILLANPAQNSSYTEGLAANITHRDGTPTQTDLPEPGTLALLGLGAVAGVLRRRKSGI